MCLHIVVADFGLRDSLAVLLTGHGFEVAAHDSDAAFRAGAEPASCDAVIVDLDLPGSAGPGLVAWLQSRPRPPRLIVLSGSAGTATRARLRGLDWPILLEKPFVAGDLLRLL